jgi:hypothetical protein
VEEISTETPLHSGLKAEQISKIFKKLFSMRIVAKAGGEV